MLAVRVSCSRLDEDFATLDLSGGFYPEEGESTYLTWIDMMPILAGQTITVALLDEVRPRIRVRPSKSCLTAIRKPSTMGRCLLSRRWSQS